MGLQLRNFSLPVGSATKTLFPVQKLLITTSWFDLSSLNSYEEYVSRLADLFCVSIQAGSQLQSDNSRDSNDVVRSCLSSVNLIGSMKFSIETGFTREMYQTLLPRALIISNR